MIFEALHEMGPWIGTLISTQPHKQNGKGEQTRQLSLPSFAKVNWMLEVLGRRDDGYHEVHTIYQAVDLRDQINFRLTTNSRITLDVAGRRVTGGEANLVCQSARMLADKKAKPEWGVQIRLVKNIPVGAGLGGGSGNAAVTLLALNQIWQCGLTRESLQPLAARLGSDVSFFLFGGTALGLGRGERVIPLPTPAIPGKLLILYPGFEISTKAAYQAGGWKRRSSEELTERDLGTTIRRFTKAIRCLEQGWASLENDFQEPLFRNYPALEMAAQRLIEAGCERVIPCGSGSALLGTVGRERGLGRALKQLTVSGREEVFPCRALPRQEYRDLLTRSGLELGRN